MFKLIKQLCKFGIVGVLNTAISMGVYYLFIWINNDLYIIGNIVGFIIGTLNSYLLNSSFVFKSAEHKKTSRRFNEIIKTYFSYGVSLGLSTLLLYLEVHAWGMSERVAPLINLLITIPLNFCMNKFWIYKRKENDMNNTAVQNYASIDKTPLVSVCIPTFNGALHIRETIESVISQDYTNLEIIISDNGSTDDTVDIVNSFQDERIRLIYNEGEHTMQGNFYNCVVNASGKYIKILCDDDLIYEDCISREVAAFENHPSVSVVTGASDVINNNSEVFMTRRKYSKDKLVDGKVFAKMTISTARNYYSETSVSMFKTNQAIDAKLYCGDIPLFCIDWDGSLLLSYIGNVFYISEQIAAFRVDNGSISVQMGDSQRKKLYQMQIDFFERHKKIGVIKLNKSDFIRYKFFVKLNMLARNLVYKFKLKK